MTASSSDTAMTKEITKRIKAFRKLSRCTLIFFRNCVLFRPTVSRAFSPFFPPRPNPRAARLAELRLCVYVIRIELMRQSCTSSLVPSLQRSQKRPRGAAIARPTEGADYRFRRVVTGCTQRGTGAGRRRHPSSGAHGWR